LEIRIQEGFSDVEIIINCPEATGEIHKLVSLLQGSEQKLFGVKSGVTSLIARQDVFYFESLEKHCFIYTASDVYETDSKLYELEAQLTDAGFFRSSKSQILNIAKIASLCPDFGGRLEVIMENSEKLIVSRQYAKLLKERLGLR